MVRHDILEWPKALHDVSWVSWVSWFSCTEDGYMMLHRWLHGHVSYAEFGTPVQCLVINPVDPSWDRTSVSWRTFLSVDPFQSNGTLLIKKVACDFNTICFGEADWKKQWRIPDQYDRSISQHSWWPSISSVHKPRWPASDFDPGSSLGLIDQLRPLLCSLGAAAQHGAAWRSISRAISEQSCGKCCCFTPKPQKPKESASVRKGWKGFCRFLCHPSLPQKFLTQSILTPSKPQTQSMTVIPISYPKGSAKLASPMDRTVCVLNVKASVEPLQRIGEIIHIETRHAFIDKVSIME